jgi:hypothetical protein
MNRFRLPLLASTALVAAAFACGGISDPTREGAVATVSGALSGTNIPNGTRVALVWRKGATGGVEVGSDVPVVNGQFSMNLPVPLDSYFFPAELEEDAPVATPLAEPAPSTGGGTPGSTGTGSRSFRMHSNGGTASGRITDPLSGAIAGFIVYVDTNGNGRLDLSGEYASSTDQILGGSKELVLVYLRGGGQLDYEKLRDKSGILPTQGFNLAWKQGRWLPLNLVELKINTSNARLPSPVCSSSSSGGQATFGSVDNDVAAPPDAPSSGSGGTDQGGSSTRGGYPQPGDPRLHCAPDGRSFTYDPSPSDCPPPPPAPTGICAPGYGTEPAVACAGMSGMGLAPGQPIPEGWPCPVPVAQDAGAAPDAGGD